MFNSCLYRGTYIESEILMNLNTRVLNGFLVLMKVQAMKVATKPRTFSMGNSQYTIHRVHAREVFDSRGNPTVEVEVTTADGKIHAAIVPSGASTGIHEACELRDGGKRMMGKGVLQAVRNVIDVLGPAVCGMDCRDQEAVDFRMIELDGTPNKTNLGANAILGVSLACARAGANAKGVPLYRHFASLAGNMSGGSDGPCTLPMPCFNVINGGCLSNRMQLQLCHLMRKCVKIR